MRSWCVKLMHRARKAVVSLGIGVFPLYGSRFGLDLFRDLKRYAPTHEFRLILDVGANVGEFALASSSAFPQAEIHAFEPVAGTFRNLRKATARRPGVKCHNLALGEREEERQIVLQATSAHNSLLFQPRETESPSQALVETVRVRRLDSFVEEHKVARVDLLKIDTEGFELEVIRGAGDAIARTAFVFCEAALDSPGGVHVPLEDISSMLSESGFRLVALYDTFYYFGDAPDGYCDALFVNQHALAGR